MRPHRLEVADVFHAHHKEFLQRWGQVVSPQQHKALRDIGLCRTAALGAHLQQCDACSYQTVSYLSCRNRHCPKCQSTARDRWLSRQAASLLPVAYSHVVFTLPEQLAPLALRNQRLLYDLLFRPPPRPCCKSPLIHTISVHASECSPYSIPGARTCATILTCIASSPPVDSPATTPVGSPADRVSSCRCAYSAVSSEARCWPSSSRLISKENSVASALQPDWPSHVSSTPCCACYVPRSGLSMPSHPSADP